MFLVSPVLNAIARARGPVAEHQLWINRHRRWRIGEAEWFLLDKLVDQNRAAVDVGANIGTYSGRLAQLCPRVHAFEPIPWLANDLRRKLPPNVTVYRIALSNEPGEATLRIPIRDGVLEHGLSTMKSRNDLTADAFETVDCPVKTMDDVISEPVGFIKIDVEGHELSVLEGASRILQGDRPNLLIESEKAHNPSCPEAVFALLRRFGYSVFTEHVGDIVPLSGTAASINFLFLPQNIVR